MFLNLVSAKNTASGIINGIDAQEKSITDFSGFYSAQKSKFGANEAYHKIKLYVYI